ncbi:hypothetical protein SO802_032210 [Lithocarpus litseifolius]|uniref:Uncharacterized protein n=1 Tax=Lithocarpus litseifolius TaxID=425828 RepID=A0AAW2BR34_9ROSI
MFRVSAVHAATRMASNMLAAYLPYMEFAPAGPLFHLPTLRIKNPLIDGARALLQFCLPHLVFWMMTGHGYDKDLV